MVVVDREEEDEEDERVEEDSSVHGRLDVSKLHTCLFGRT